MCGRSLKLFYPYFHTYTHRQTKASIHQSCLTNNNLTPAKKSPASQILIFCPAWLSLCRPLMHTGTHTQIQTVSGCAFSGNIINGVCPGCRKHLPTALSDWCTATSHSLSSLKISAEHLACSDSTVQIPPSIRISWPQTALQIPPASSYGPNSSSPRLLYLFSLSVLSPPPSLHLLRVKVCLD